VESIPAIDNDDWAARESHFAKIKLRDIYPLGRKKLYYLFDFGDKWTFEIRKARGGKKLEAGIKYPRVVEAIGPDPEQYPIWEDGRMHFGTRRKNRIPSFPCPSVGTHPGCSESP